MTTAEKKLFAILIFIIIPLVLFIAKSTYWAAMVPVVTCLVGLLSKEGYEEKLYSMATAAPAAGLMFTLLGLGQIIGPAIATHSVDQIGYGIAVKIEASVCGLLLRIFFIVIISRQKKYEKETI